MPKKKTIHLKNVSRELQRVARDLANLQKKAEPATRKLLDLKIKKVQRVLVAMDAACGGGIPGPVAVLPFGGKAIAGGKQGKKN